MTNAETTCQHGYTVMHETVMDDDERSACCGAPCTIYSDTAEWYCKCCHATVVGGDTVPSIRVQVRDDVGNCGHCLRPLDVRTLRLVHRADYTFTVCGDCAGRFYR